MSGIVSSTAAIAASDNSSDSASHTKKSSNKSEIDIVDQKIIKCINEINYLNQKRQIKWSNQMKNHLDRFYSSDPSNTSNVTNNNDSSLNTSTNSHTSVHNTTPNNADSSEHDKKITLLTKKLKSYEKRRQKLLYDSKKNNNNNSTSHSTENNSTSSATHSDPTTTTTNHSNLPENATGSKNGSHANGLNILGNNNNNNNNNNVESSSNTLPSTHLSTPIQQSNLSSTLQAPKSSLSFRNNSFMNPNGKLLFNNEDLNSVKLASNNNLAADESNSNINNNQKQSTLFYLNADGNVSNVKLTNNNSNNSNNATGGETNELLNNDDQLNASSNSNNNNNNKASFERNNMIFLQVEQQIYYFKLQQEKMQADLEELQKKIIENQQILMKELQHTCNQISEPVHKLSFNLYKSYEQKLDDLKSTLERSTQSFNYNLTHIHRDVKETKEDVTYMKNRIEILEKTQKVHNIDNANPTNYYQLFYKLLDILLTLATIILLAFTNMIASIKFIFLLYPRIIVFMFFIYLIFFYLVDFDKLDEYFYQILVNDPTFSSASASLKNRFKKNTSLFLGGGDGKSNLTYISRFIQTVYSLIFRHEASSSSS